jgi:hypothetical protein
MKLNRSTRQRRYGSRNQRMQNLSLVDRYGLLLVMLALIVLAA